MKLLCFGDSNTYGYDPRSYLGDRYPSSVRWVDKLARQLECDTLNGGQNGRMIPANAHNLPSATHCVVMLGSNDLLQGFSAAEVTHRMEVFLTSALTKFEKILLVAPPPMKYGDWVTEERLLVESAKIASFYEGLAKKLNLSFADAGLWNVELTFDGVHFSERGHQSFYTGIKCTLSGLL